MEHECTKVDTLTSIRNQIADLFKMQRDGDRRLTQMETALTGIGDEPGFIGDTKETLSIVSQTTMETAEGMREIRREAKAQKERADEDHETLVKIARAVAPPKNSVGLFLKRSAPFWAAVAGVIVAYLGMRQAEVVALANAAGKMIGGE
jgi:hypothetical protein